MPLPGDLQKFETLKEIVTRLRSPEGCPWDRAQSFSSLRPNLLEESYEALEAIDAGDKEGACEELGDLMLLVLLYSQIAAEEGSFTIEDVVRHISAKLIHRHPHVFGNLVVDGVKAVLANWQSLKHAEPNNKGKSLLEGIPRSMPALSYSQEIQRRVATVGFDWEHISGVIDKLKEEAQELAESRDQQEMEQEFGDVVFTLANLALKMGVDLESTLRMANRRFYQRFSHMEKECQQQNISFAGLPADDKEALWQKAKREVL